MPLKGSYPCASSSIVP